MGLCTLLKLNRQEETRDRRSVCVCVCMTEIVTEIALVHMCHRKMIENTCAKKQREAESLVKAEKKLGQKNVR